MLLLAAAQELPLPGMYTGDETWFEAVSLRPPLLFLGQHLSAEPLATLRSLLCCEPTNKPRARLPSGALMRRVCPFSIPGLAADRENYLQLSRHR